LSLPGFDALQPVLFPLKRSGKLLPAIGCCSWSAACRLVFCSPRPDYRFSGAAFWCFFSAALLLVTMR
jgi:hypothetical protein